MEDDTESKPFAIVAIGASAGGLAAIEALLTELPPSSPMAFVIVTHTHEGQTTLLPEILEKTTKLPVHETAGGVLEPGHVYVPTPGGRLTIKAGVLDVSFESDRRALPIDHFFRSLAADQRERAIGVILSGTGSDGTLGIRAIKAESGLALAQSPETAEYDNMPSSVIDTQLVDFVAPPMELGRWLAEHASAEPPRTDLRSLPGIRDLIRDRTGHDFSQFKDTTFVRRVERRMSVHQLTTQDEYIKYLERTPQEIDLLLKDLLIGVTSFFRDPQAFDALSNALEQLIARKGSGDTLRIWVPGCSSGEEAYSIAMLVQEQLEASRRRLAVQIFATDIDRDAIDRARLGRFPEGIAADVSRERLERYFVADEDGYQISKEIRAMIVFANQDLIGDPPFTRVDLVSCRNLLIYLKPELQKRIIALFHYALVDGGLLLLGSSESIGRLHQQFEVIDQKAKLFRRVSGSRAAAEFPLAGTSKTAPGQRIAANRESELAAILEQSLSEHFVPPSVVVDKRGEIVHIHGRTGRFLEPSPGRPTHNVLSMARDGLRGVLSAAIRHGGPDVKVYRAVDVRVNGGRERVTVKAFKLDRPEPVRDLLVLSFELWTPSDERALPESEDEPGLIAELEQELRFTKDSLQTTIEELETSNEELKSTNEELQSTNEELQSANEELETSREEMQSLNEELQTVNAELREKVDTVSEINNDMRNLLNGTEIATVFLDDQLRIKRFTERARKVIRLIESDVGRPLADLAPQLDEQDLAEDARSVLDTLVPQERELQAKDGTWYLTRILPYRTSNNVIAGLVLTFVDITQLKVALDAADARRRLAESLVESARSPTVVLDKHQRVILASPEFCVLTGEPREKIVDVSLFEVAGGRWDSPELRAAVAETRGGDHEAQVSLQPLVIDVERIDHQRVLEYVVLTFNGADQEAAR